MGLTSTTPQSETLGDGAPKHSRQGVKAFLHPVLGEKIRLIRSLQDHSDPEAKRHVNPGAL